MKHFYSKFFFAFFALFAICVPAGAQHSDLSARQLKPDEGAAILGEFRKYRLPGDYCMQIEIVHKPRKSDDEKVYTGTLWGSWNNVGAVTRVELRGNGKTKKFLIQSGSNPGLWGVDENGEIVKMEKDSTRPFFEDLIFTPFDLQTPFLFWENFKYEETRRHRGRPVHFFKMFPPEDFKKLHHEIGFVRIGFDRAYNALVNADVRDSDEKKLKTFSIVSVKKVQEIYTFKELELRDERSRDKDALVVREAALRLRLPPEFFLPENLNGATPSVPAHAFSPLD